MSIRNFPKFVFSHHVLFLKLIFSVAFFSNLIRHKIEKQRSSFFCVLLSLRSILTYKYWRQTLTPPSAMTPCHRSSSVDNFIAGAFASMRAQQLLLSTLPARHCITLHAVGRSVSVQIQQQVYLCIHRGIINIQLRLRPHK